MTKKPPNPYARPGQAKLPTTSHQVSGSAAFGQHAKSLPTGAEAFGGSDTVMPLRGALLFGNDPAGLPRGSEAFGGSDPSQPLRGALLFGNDPAGLPRGSEAFGGSDPSTPLRGALLFGNDPDGAPRGALLFGNDPKGAARGSEAFGAGQNVPDRLYKDPITYDFGGVLLAVDTEGLAGIRKDPRDRVRERVLAVLERRLGIESARLRHGLGENAIPWGRLARESDLDKPLAELLRAWWKVAPGHLLGVGQTRDLLESSERMHSFELRCEWDSRPVRLTVLQKNADGAESAVAYAEVAHHKQHEFFVFRTPEKLVFAYVDVVVPRRNAQTARIRNADGSLVGTFELTTPSVNENIEEGARVRLKGVLKDASERVAFKLEEERAGPKSFLAVLSSADGTAKVGRIEDKLSGGKIRTLIEVDVMMPKLLTWAVGALMADMARLRRTGWPDAPSGPAEEEIETVEQALGPRRRR